MPTARCGGIELVPNQNSFAHLERWLRHDAYKHLAECPDGFEHPIAGWRTFGGTLAPTEESAAFIDTLYEEFLPNFTSKQLHIGCDEPWELGQGRSQERVDREGKHLLYMEFLNRLFALAEKHEHRAQFWADIILERPDLVPQLPKNVTPVIWGYEADSPYAEQCRSSPTQALRATFTWLQARVIGTASAGDSMCARDNITLAAARRPQAWREWIATHRVGRQRSPPTVADAVPSADYGCTSGMGLPDRRRRAARADRRAVLPRRSSGSWRCDLCTGEDRRTAAATRAAEQLPAHRIFCD